MIALAKSLIRENKGLTAALVALYTLTVALVMVVAMVPDTVRASLDAFFDDCNTADCYIYTYSADETLVAENAPTAASTAATLEAIREIDGVKDAVVRRACECTVRMPDGKLCLMNFMSVPEDSFMLMWRYGSDNEGTCSAQAGTGLAVNKRYTLFSDLAPGDEVEVLSPLGDRPAKVTDVVACAESVISLRDEFSWYEDESYGYFYLSEELYDELFGTQVGYQHWLLDIDESCDSAEVAASAAALLQSYSWLSVLLRTESIPHETIYGNLDTLDSVCTYLPSLMLVIALGFSVLFISQVVLRSRAFIGLLKALGMSSGRISGVFLLYVLAPALCGMLLGAAIGVVCSRVLVGLYAEQFTLPNILLGCNASFLVPQLLGIACLAALACLLACLSIGKVDPAEAYGGSSDGTAKKPSVLARKLPVGPFTKVAISLAMHNRMRIVNCSACIAASLCLVTAGVMLFLSMNASMRFTFDERLLYDSLVDVTNAAKGAEAIEELDEAAQVEPVLRAYAQVSARADSTDDAEYIQVNGISQDAGLIALYDAKGRRIAVPETGIVIDEGLANRLGVSEGDTVYVQGTALRVAGIAREYVDPISYVSLEQMEQLGIATSSVVTVTLADGVSHTEFREAVYEADPSAYVLFLDSQQQNMGASMRAINIPIAFIVALSVLIGLIIVYNMTELSITERRREYATLLVLGTGNARIVGITLAESVGELVLALLFGCPVAYFAAGIVLDGMCSVNIQYPIVMPVQAMICACVITAAYVVAATLMAQARIHHWNPLTILNTGE